ncbi:unnamed protein product [Spirodela intermedia]|uniref:Uncharacterized protein n=1 Tax=Spirodela intermedia TaxID=51605 RepID=A0A7I8KC98_SPIIN|nr:unnamed protein product [Spirodela intermedia]
MVDSRVTHNKAVNSEARTLTEATRGAQLRLGTWEGRVDFMVLPMDDFSAILGIDFLTRAQAGIVPQWRAVLLAGGPAPCFVKGDETFLITLLELEQSAEPGEDGTRPSYPQFQDLLLERISTRLPPCHEVEHGRELTSGTRPPANVLYKMTPMFLEKLHR